MRLKLVFGSGSVFVLEICPQPGGEMVTRQRAVTLLTHQVSFRQYLSTHPQFAKEMSGVQINKHYRQWTLPITESSLSETRLWISRLFHFYCPNKYLSVTSPSRNRRRRRYFHITSLQFSIATRECVLFWVNELELKLSLDIVVP